MELSFKKQTYNLNEFLDYLRAKENTEEYIAGKILNDKRLTALSTFVIATFIHCKTALAKGDIGKIDVAGSTMLNIVRSIGYWICIIMALIEIIRSLMQGDTKSVGKIIMKYIIAFASFYFLPWLFDIIKGIFG